MAVENETRAHGDRRRLPPAIGLAFWLIVVPIALIGLGLWQAERADHLLASVETSSVDMNRTLAEIRQIAQETPNAIIRFGEDGARAYTASMAVAEIENAVGQAETDQWVSVVRRPFAFGTIAGGALALGGGALGLAAANVAGFRARRSRDQLIRSFTRLRSVLPFLLAALMLGFGVAGLCATLFETISIPLWSAVSGNGIKLAFAGIVLAGIALYCAVSAVRGLRKVFALVAPEPIEAPAHIVTQADAPALWRFVGDLADRTDAQRPDTIISGLTDGFFVTESPVRLVPDGQLLGGRILHLPAPLLELLDAAEVSAIVGHELAHFSGEDTRYSRRFVPIYSGLWRSLGALRAADVGGDPAIGAGLRLGFHALSRFDTAVAHWSRLREFEADRRGSLVSGADAAASALIRSHVAAPATYGVLDRAFEGDAAVGVDLVAATAAVAAERGFDDPAGHLEDRQPHPTDSHPPTSQRIRALGVAVDGVLLTRATRRPDPATPSFAAQSFTDWSGFCRALSADFLQNAAVVRTEHRAWLTEAASSVGDQEVVLFENTGGMAVLMAVIAALLGAFVACIYLFPVTFGFGNDESAKAVVAIILGLGIVMCLLFFISFRRRAVRPLMVLTPDALSSPWLSGPVRWTDVAAYQVFAAHRLALHLSLHDDVPLPRRARFSLYNKVKAKRRLVVLDALGIRGMKAAAFSELIGQYLQAAYAKRELAA